MKKTLLVIFLLSTVFAGTADGLWAQNDTLQQSRLKRYWNSLVHGNVDRTFERRMDLSFIIAPSYTREGSFGIGGAATGLYRLDRRDSLMQPSDISLSGNASVNGFYTLTVKGNNHFRGNRSRLSYRLQFQNKNLDFWGVSYDACRVNPVSGYRRQMVRWESDYVESDYVYKLTPDFHVGAALNLNYTRATRLTRPEYLAEQRSSYFFTGVGLSLQYDTRDFILNPKRGIYFLVREVFYPHWLSSHDRNIFATTFTFDAFVPVWKGGVLAFDLYGQLNGDDVPWTLREELGAGTSRMRGYYAGRYIDNNQLSAQMELRQLRMKDMLPNYGLGLRVEFKHNVNIRIDYGFGKDTAGFVFQFAEAF